MGFAAPRGDAACEPFGGARFDGDAGAVTAGIRGRWRRQEPESYSWLHAMSSGTPSEADLELPWHGLAPEAVAHRLGVGLTGLAQTEVEERLKRFEAWVDGDDVLVDREEVEAWELEHPQPYDRDAYLGLYADAHGVPDGPNSSAQPHAGAQGGAT